jgi:hypothetical protein
MQNTYSSQHILLNWCSCDAGPAALVTKNVTGLCVKYVFSYHHQQQQQQATASIVDVTCNCCHRLHAAKEPLLHAADAAMTSCCQHAALPSSTPTDGTQIICIFHVNKLSAMTTETAATPRKWTTRTRAWRTLCLRVSAAPTLTPPADLDFPLCLPMCAAVPTRQHSLENATVAA